MSAVNTVEVRAACEQKLYLFTFFNKLLSELLAVVRAPNLNAVKSELDIFVKIILIIIFTCVSKNINASYGYNYVNYLL